MNFTDKVVLITGAGSGIGAACAVQFAGLSAKLSLIDKNEERLRDVSEEIKSITGVIPLTIVVDLDIDEEVRRVIDETVNNYGRIDVLVNNAGIGFVAGITDGIEYYDKVMRTNARSVYLLTSYAIPHLIMSTGNIVNISSAGSVKPVPAFIAYSMSKAAIDMFTKCLARQLAVNGIRVNSVNPGAVKTNIMEKAGINKDQASVFFKKCAKSSALGKIATANDIANLVMFLASDKSKSITGSAHFIENGILISNNQCKLSKYQ